MSDQIMLKHIPVKATDRATHIRVNVYYDIGGGVYSNRARGYYISVFPIKEEDGLLSIEVYSGKIELLLTVSRKSKKAEAEAIQIAEARMSDLVDYVCKKNGLVLLDN